MPASLVNILCAKETIVANDKVSSTMGLHSLVKLPQHIVHPMLHSANDLLASLQYVSCMIHMVGLSVLSHLIIELILLLAFCISLIIWWSIGTAGSKLKGMLSSSSVCLSAIVSSQAVCWYNSTEFIMLSSIVIAAACSSGETMMLMRLMSPEMKCHCL